MARKTDIRLRRSAVSGAVPGGADLNLGELALNTADGAIFVKNGDGDIVTVSHDGIIHYDEPNTRVGIGTTSPGTKLHINSGTSDVVSIFESTDTYADIRLKDNDGSSYIRNSQGNLFLQADREDAVNNTTIRFHIDNSEKSRIDSNGNFLVGTTSAGNSSAGFRAYAGGNGAFTIAGTTLNLNRLSSDGEILSLQKDTVAVGSIGTYASDLHIGTGNTGIGFNDNGRSIVPMNTSTPAYAGSLISLGTSSVKFKDLHLSGTANVGTKVITKTTNGEVLRFERASDSLRYNSITSNSLDSGEAFISFKVHDGVSATSQADVLHLKGNGKVGIGTTSPATNLTVEGSGANGIELNRNGADASQSARLFFDSSTSGYALMNVAGSLTFNSGSTAGSSSGTERMRIDSTGGVGIGTTNPQAALHVAGGFNATAPTGNGVMMGYYLNSYGYIQLNGTSGGYIDFSTSGTDHKGRILYDNTDDYLRLDTNGSERLRIDSSGRLLVGTTSVGYSGVDLTVGATTDSQNGVSIQTSTTGIGYLLFGDGTGASAYVGQIAYAHSDNSMQFDTAGAERMRIDSSGRLGLGTSNPTYSLDVSSSSVLTGRIQSSSGETILELDNTNTNGRRFMIISGGNSGSLAGGKFGVFDATAGATRLAIDSSGKVGINNTSPDGILQATHSANSENHISYEIGNSAVASTNRGGFAIYELGTKKASWVYNRDGSGQTDFSADRFRFRNNAETTEYARIDSSGNLLVGKTSLTIANAGTEVRNNGQLLVTADGDNPVDFNRLTSDGTIANFRKDSTVVGKISTYSSGIDISNSTYGVRFAGSTIFPVTSVGSVSDNVVSLGYSSGRFKDLYLSGTAYTNGVGIGTSSVIGKLHANDSAGATLTLTRTSGATSGNLGKIRFGNTDIDSDLASIVAIQDGATNNSALTFGTQTAGAAVAERMRIDSTGNVGIGTSSPARQFHVHDASASYLHLTNNTTGSTGSDGASISMAGTSLQISNRENGVLQMYTNGTERMRLDSSGNTGIGTSSPSSKLTVAGDIELTTGDLKYTGGINWDIAHHGASQNIVFKTTPSGGSVTERMRIDSSGRVGVGTSSPDVYGIHASNSSSSVYFKSVSGSIQTLYGGATALGYGLLGTTTNHPLVIYTNNSERARIDSNGHLLVGKTSLTIANAGTEVRNNGQLLVTADGDNPVDFNRLTSDGTIANFRKDSTVVGSIGVRSGALYIESASANFSGLDFESSCILPRKSGSLSNGAVSLGLGSYKFSDLHLSGTVNAGAGIHTLGDTTGSSQLVLLAGTANNSTLDFGDSADSNIGRIQYVHPHDAMTFRTNNSERMRIDSSGRLGLGTSSPTEKMEISGGHLKVTNAGNANIYINANNANSEATIYFEEQDSVKARIAHVASNDSMVFTDGAYTDTMTLKGAKVGIGTTAPTSPLHVTGAAKVTGTITVGASHTLGDVGQTDDFIIQSSENNNLILKAGVDSDSLILKTTNTALTINPEGKITIEEETTIDDDINLSLTGSVKGKIGVSGSLGNDIYIASGTTSSAGFGLRFIDYNVTEAALPCRGDGSTADNLMDLGNSGSRFDDIYATNGTINTSDRNEKQDIQALTDAEQRVATACKGLIRRFRWQDAVEEKGDDARYHFGVIAQDLQDAFEAEGLDAGDYGMFISSTWTDDEGNEQTRLGVRYNELLAFIITTL